MERGDDGGDVAVGGVAGSQVERNGRRGSLSLSERGWLGLGKHPKVPELFRSAFILVTVAASFSESLDRPARLG